MAKHKKKSNKKEAEVPEGTKKLNNLVKKRKQEQEQEESKPESKVPKIPEVNVGMLLEKLPDAKINKRKDEFVKFIKGDCYVRDISYGIQVSENFHGAPRKVIGRIENQKDLDKWVNTIKENIKNYTPPATGLKEHEPTDIIKVPIRVSTRDRMKSLSRENESYNAVINRALDKLAE
jgi:hypothetical protein